VWLDTSNSDPRFSRNRLREEVLPVLEALHPGASRRISAQAERLAAEADQEAELLELALGAICGPRAGELQRQPISSLSAAGQRRLLQHWLVRQTGHNPGSRTLETLVQRLQNGGVRGSLDLPAGWRVHWNLNTLALTTPTGIDG
jgi:tRNA(Ile)-lysidine synthase